MTLTAREKEERRRAREVRKEYEAQVENVVTLMLALHDAGFRALFLESMLMNVSPFSAFICVWLDDIEINPDRMLTLQAVADEHDASISLAQPLGPNTPSRIRLWPRRQ